MEFWFLYITFSWFFYKNRQTQRSWTIYSRFLSADLDFFYKLIAKYKMMDYHLRKMRYLVNSTEVGFHQKLII